jgi:2-iminobutanoate/2-iminopropanoate deaminase
MNAFAEILEAIAHAPVKKRAMTNHGVLNEAFAYAKPSSFSRGMRIDSERPDDSADLRHRFDRRERRERAHRRFSRADAAHVCQHHRTARERRLHLARHRAHHVLPARHRARLRGIQRGAHAFFKEQGLDPLPASTGIQAISAGRNC